MFAPGKEPVMKNIECLRMLITEQLDKIQDEDLLDLILQLLITEGGQQTLDAGVLGVG
jgi:hypothetical protein